MPSRPSPSLQPARTGPICRLRAVFCVWTVVHAVHVIRLAEGEHLIQAPTCTRACRSGGCGNARGRQDRLPPPGSSPPRGAREGSACPGAAGRPVVYRSGCVELVDVVSVSASTSASAPGASSSASVSVSRSPSTATGSPADLRPPRAFLGGHQRAVGGGGGVIHHRIGRGIGIDARFGSRIDRAGDRAGDGAGHGTGHLRAGGGGAGGGDKGGGKGSELGHDACPILVIGTLDTRSCAAGPANAPIRALRLAKRAGSSAVYRRFSRRSCRGRAAGAGRTNLCLGRAASLFRRR